MIFSQPLIKYQGVCLVADISFVLHSDWLDSLLNLPVEEQDKVIADTVRYGLGREIVYADDPYVQTMVKMKAKDIDYSKEKYELKKKLAAMGGRQKKVNDKQVWDLAQQGLKAAKIAELLGCAKSSIDHNLGWKMRKQPWIEEGQDDFEFSIQNWE